MHTGVFFLINTMQYTDFIQWYAFESNVMSFLNGINLTSYAVNWAPAHQQHNTTL